MSRCAYCHDPLEGLRVPACGACRTLLHTDCWELARSCPTLGRGQVQRSPRPLAVNHFDELFEKLLFVLLWFGYGALWRSSWPVQW